MCFLISIDIILGVLGGAISLRSSDSKGNVKLVEIDNPIVNLPTIQNSEENAHKDSGGDPGK